MHEHYWTNKGITIRFQNNLNGIQQYSSILSFWFYFAVEIPKAKNQFCCETKGRIQKNLWFASFSAIEFKIQKNDAPY